MTRFQYAADMAMCALWIVTYALCFISTVKHKYPALSPVTQLLIAPFEFSVVFRLVRIGSFRLDYISAAYTVWTLLELALVFVILKYGFRFAVKKTVPYLASLAATTALMVWLVAYKDQMYFFSYFNTFVGELFWFRYIFKKEYPIKALNFAAFIAKFIGDAVSVPVYIGAGTVFSRAMCVLLPVLDLSFIIAFLYNDRLNKKNTAASAAKA